MFSSFFCQKNPSSPSLAFTYFSTSDNNRQGTYCSKSSSSASTLIGTTCWAGTMVIPAKQPPQYHSQEKKMVAVVVVVVVVVLPRDAVVWWSFWFVDSFASSFGRQSNYPRHCRRFRPCCLLPNKTMSSMVAKFDSSWRLVWKEPDITRWAKWFGFHPLFKNSKTKAESIPRW